MVHEGRICRGGLEAGKLFRCAEPDLMRCAHICVDGTMWRNFGLRRIERYCTLVNTRLRKNVCLDRECTISILLCTTEVELRVPARTTLRDLLFEQGVEVPFGGWGRCRGCRIRVHAGTAEITAVQRERLSEEELKIGWRLACQGSLIDDLVVELRQWDAAILEDDSLFAFEPRPGLGVAVDLGTTTLVAQLLDLRTSRVLAVRTSLNGQACYGADVMSRIEYACGDGHLPALAQLLRLQITSLIDQLVFSAKVRSTEIRDVVLDDNMGMYHPFCGLDVEPLAHYLFESPHAGLKVFPAGKLGWNLNAEATVRFLSCLGGFVGNDVLAAVLATRLGESVEIVAFFDLGTNGEIVVGNSAGLLCASTAV